MASVVRTDVAVPARVVVCLEDVQDARVAAAVPVGGLGEVAVLKVLELADVGEGDAVRVLTHDARHIVFRVGIQAAGAEGQAVVGIVHH